VPFWFNFASNCVILIVIFRSLAICRTFSPHRFIEKEVSRQVHISGKIDQKGSPVFHKTGPPNVSEHKPYTPIRRAVRDVRNCQRLAARAVMVLLVFSPSGRVEQLWFLKKD
jgi:hypothetical protein